MITKLKLRTFKGIFAVIDSALWGSNAFAHGKKVHINSESYMNVMLPHELGHVKNNISFGFGKFLQVTRHALAMNPMCYLPLFILGVAAFRDKKNDGEKSESTIGKGLDFVKDNCVGLTAATQIPTLAEEGLASAKGLKMVKNYVKPNEFKMLRGAMGKAWWTYFCGAAAFTGMVFVANTVKNSVSSLSKNA